MTTCGETDPAHQDSPLARQQRESAAGFFAATSHYWSERWPRFFRSLILVLLLADLLTITFTGERFFDALLFARLEIERMTLYFLDDVFGLDLALETAQSILKGFALLNSNLCQKKHLQTFPERDIYQDTPDFAGRRT